jgi:hypothetical protein
MRIRHVLPLALLVSLLRLSAQVAVEVVLDQDKFLAGETLQAGVRIVNRSGQTLHLGEDNEWVKFSIETVAGRVVPQLSGPPVKNPFKLDSTERGTLRVNLEPHFDLHQLGRYRITANVRIKEWAGTITTKPETFEVIEGALLWEQEFGVPRGGDGQQPPELRKYTLLHANYLKTQLRLYLRVSSGDGRVIKLITVGPMISFGQPEQQLDKQNRIHLLYQNSAKAFAYLVVNPDGIIEVREIHEYTDTRPRLRLDDKGEIKVAGGLRRVTADDLPAPSDPKPEPKPEPTPDLKDDGKPPKP